MRARLLSILLVANSLTGCLGCFEFEFPDLYDDPWLGDPGYVSCSSDAECTGEGKRCDEAAERCYLPCALDSDCPNNGLCCVERVETKAQLVCVTVASCVAPTCPPEAPLAIDRACHMRCVEDADCPFEGEFCCDALPEPLCMTSSTCARTHPCEAGMARGADGVCRPTCASVADCYPLGAWCDDDQLCHGALAGQKANACAAAVGAPPMDPSAPLLYDARPIGLEATVPTACFSDDLCGRDRFACGSSIRVWDPDGDLPTEPAELADAVEVLLEDGSRLAPYSLELSQGDSDVLHLHTCVDSPSTFEAAAVRLRDRAGHGSNALCLQPQAP